MTFSRQYAESGLAKGHDYVDNKKGYLSSYILSIYLLIFFSTYLFDDYHEIFEPIEGQCRKYNLGLLIWAVKWHHKVHILSSDPCCMRVCSWSTWYMLCLSGRNICA